MSQTQKETGREYRKRRLAMIKAGSWVPNPIYKKAEPIVCDSCKKKFHRPRANRNRNDVQGQYCTRQCMADAFAGKFLKDRSPRWKGDTITKCSNCAGIITRPKWYQGSRVQSFCNRQCFGEWKSKNWTGSDNPCWRGGKPYYYGGNWKRQQYEARKRDGFQCQYCGLPESEWRRALDVHHILPFRFFKKDYKQANRLTNLISLCGVCHTTLEHISKHGNVTTWDELRKAAPKCLL